MTLPLIVPIVNLDSRPLPSGPSNKRRSCLDDLPQSNLTSAPPPGMRDESRSRSKAKKNRSREPISSAPLTNEARSAMMAKCDENEFQVDTELEGMFLHMVKI